MRIILDFLDDEHYLDVYLSRDEIDHLIVKGLIEGDDVVHEKKWNIIVLEDKNEDS